MNETMTERMVCSADHPFSLVGPRSGAIWQHPDAELIGEQEDGYPGGDLVTYQCPHCGLRFKVELAQ